MSGAPVPHRAAFAPHGVMIAGWYGMDNVGDDAILQQFLAELPPSPQLHVTVLAHNAARVHARHGGAYLTALDHVRLTDRRGLRYLLRGRARPLLEALRRSDIFVLGGGSLLHDRSGLHGLLPVVDDIFLARQLGRPVWLYALGVGPLRTRAGRLLARQALQRCDVITLRDQGSADLVESLGIERSRIDVVADPAFLLAPEPPPARAVAALVGAAAGAERDVAALTGGAGHQLADRVGVFLKTALQLAPPAQDRLVAWLAAELDAIHRSHGLRFVMLPMMAQPQDDDRVIARAVRERMTTGSAVVAERSFPPEEMAWLAGRFCCNIAVRLHALIFSLAAQVPAVGIDYDPKIGHLLRDFGLSAYRVDMAEPAAGALSDAVARMLSERDDYAALLAAKMPLARASAARFFERLRAALA